MAKLQTRRCISLNRERYDILKAVAEANNTSMSKIVEAALAPLLFPETDPPTSMAEYDPTEKPRGHVQHPEHP